MKKLPLRSLVGCAAATVFYLSLPFVVSSQGLAAETPATIAPGEIAAGPFKPTDESLKQYQCPDWFRDAKFGIWACWGPQCVPAKNEWYARNLYVEGPVNQFHVSHYGHPSKFGYKDFIPLWKAERFDPERLMSLYKKAGAKYFVSIGIFHDNFSLYASKIHRWNSVGMGPQRDIAGEWQKAAKKHGLYFGMTEHLAASWWFYSACKGADKTGPMAGVPYDGNDPAFADLYWSGNANPKIKYYGTDVPDTFKQAWFQRINEIVDLYHPDLLYSDSPLPYPDDVGRKMLAHYYNDNCTRHDGKLEAVYNCKQDAKGRWVQDLERGVMDKINPEPWQTDTCVGNWFYESGVTYKSTATVLQMLVDIVSKNGNLLLNFPLRADGTLDEKEEMILGDLAAWFPANGEGVYGTRPWKISKEGPTQNLKSGHFNEGKVNYTDKDLRFTMSKDGGTLYVFTLLKPNGALRITSLGTNAKLADKPVIQVQMLGQSAPLTWKQEADALVVTLPADLPSWDVVGFKVSFGIQNVQAAETPLEKTIADIDKTIAEDLKPMPVAYEITSQATADGSLVLSASDANIQSETIVKSQDGGRVRLGSWSNPNDFVSWSFKIDHPGTLEAEITYSCAEPGSEFLVEMGKQQLAGKTVSTGSWSKYRTDVLGVLYIEKPGQYTISLKPKPGQKWNDIGLNQLAIKRIQ